MSDILSLLDGVRDNGNGQFMAICPAHDDKNPSLSVKQCDDGTTQLIHCFAGCETEDVLTAIGLTFTDIMPERLHKRSHKPTVDKAAILEAARHELITAAIIISRFTDNERLCVAAGRISNAVERLWPKRVPIEIRNIRRNQ